MKRKVALILTILMFGVMMAGCINQQTVTPSTVTKEVTKTETQAKTEYSTTTVTETVTITATPKKYPLTIVDDTGKKVTIEKEPQRIVSLAPSITEMLFFIGAGDKLVGVTQWADYPPQVEKITKVGGYGKYANIEIIASLKPDLILADTMSLSIRDKLEEIAPVVIINPTSIDDIYAKIELIGKIVNRESEAKAVVQFMKAKIAEIQDRVKDRPKVKVFVYLSPGQSGIWTAGKGTFIDEAISIAGGENVFHDVKGWKEVSMEEILARNPDVIIMSSMGGYADPNSLCGTPLEKTNAVKNGRVYVLTQDEDNMLSRPGPRIVYGIEALARYLHPEAYGIQFTPFACKAEATG
ncbi:ABC transporter substrate-binding protein [Thermococcus barophilus]|uniref:Periplasmic binding protein, iron transporter n=1 Tax=Thermococcus barophilus TaxID=55802 RepID=A0A0S1X9W8_THEBA|nr:ABC transporter substrate-binding protein [Thermococcus barophilus]ALM74581.1 Periplasmic binding protein, iron transporter [Thermococcus barophilus]